MLLPSPEGNMHLTYHEGSEHQDRDRPALSEDKVTALAGLLFNALKSYSEYSMVIGVSEDVLIDGDFNLVKVTEMFLRDAQKIFLW